MSSDWRPLGLQPLHIFTKNICNIFKLLNFHVLFYTVICWVIATNFSISFQEVNYIFQTYSQGKISQLFSALSTIFSAFKTVTGTCYFRFYHTFSNELNFKQSFINKQHLKKFYYHKARYKLGAGHIKVKKVLKIYKKIIVSNLT